MSACRSALPITGPCGEPSSRSSCARVPPTTGTAPLFARAPPTVIECCGRDRPDVVCFCPLLSARETLATRDGDRSCLVIGIEARITDRRAGPLQPAYRSHLLGRPPAPRRSDSAIGGARRNRPVARPGPAPGSACERPHNRAGCAPSPGSFRRHRASGAAAASRSRSCFTSTRPTSAASPRRARKPSRSCGPRPLMAVVMIVLVPGDARRPPRYADAPAAGTRAGQEGRPRGQAVDQRGHQEAGGPARLDRGDSHRRGAAARPRPLAEPDRRARHRHRLRPLDPGDERRGDAGPGLSRSRRPPS